VLFGATGALKAVNQKANLDSVRHPSPVVGRADIPSNDQYIQVACHAYGSERDRLRHGDALLRLRPRIKAIFMARKQARALGLIARYSELSIRRSERPLEQ
jgi:hypothetical protein